MCRNEAQLAIASRSVWVGEAYGIRRPIRRHVVIYQGRPLNVFLEDRRFRACLAPGGLDEAAHAGMVAGLLASPGKWNDVIWPASIRDGAGLLVLSGRLIGRTELEDRCAIEILGPGDLLRPWQAQEPCSGWLDTLSTARMGVLDASFMNRTSSLPAVHAHLVERAIARSRHLAVIAAIRSQPRIEARVRLMLEHLADRWGQPSVNGVLVPRLNQALLGELVAVSRQTVCCALNAMRHSEELQVTPGGWLVRC